MKSVPLSPAQADALRAVAAVGTGVGIRTSTARALEARGLIVVVGSAFGGRGKACWLLKAGRDAHERSPGARRAA